MPQSNPTPLNSSFYSRRKKESCFKNTPPSPTFSIPHPHPTFPFPQNHANTHSSPGDAVPRDFIPQMIQWYRDGKFPIEKLVTFLPVADFPTALKGVETGEMVKPVLVW